MMHVLERDRLVARPKSDVLAFSERDDEDALPAR